MNYDKPLCHCPRKANGKLFFNMFFVPQTLGKVGKVLKVYSDGDLRISFNGKVWTYNPQCAKVEETSRPDLNNTMMGDREEVHPGKD